jgi:hypothetical protein
MRNFLLAATALLSLASPAEGMVAGAPAVPARSSEVRLDHISIVNSRD